ncbi:DUF6378 domain-containing protein [Microvirga sp. TS319]|uniref:DUF6378 domain-containing protein n=1 Tax=Microvirga sp. TS319 TaxID=3241165 RepID=UPI00351A3357
MMFTPATAIASSAADLIGGDRAKTHGDALETFSRTASLFNGILTAAGIATSRPLDAHDVCNLLEGLKIARRYSGSFNIDDYIDGAGYAACAGEVRQRLTALRKSDPPRSTASDPP